MRYLVLATLLCCSVGWARKKPAYTYQDGLLVSFKNVATGSTCSQTANTKGDINATTDDAGNTDGTVNATTNGSTNCRSTGWVYYTISVGDHTYVVHHAYAFLNRSSNLWGQLPGTHLQVRTDPKGFYVRIKTKESKFVIVEAK